MTIRKEVADFVALGTLPPFTAEPEVIARHEEALHRIQRPATVDEAAILLKCFGPDDCFGLAWTLLHLIESAPESPLVEPPPAEANQWLHRLWTGLVNAGRR